MRSLAAHRVTIAWVVASALTLLSWWLRLEHDGGTVSASTAATIGVLAVALVKCRLILREFMGVRRAPPWLKLGTDVWLVGLWAAILSLYLG
jgi:hypothetical protein